MQGQRKLPRKPTYRLFDILQAKMAILPSRKQLLLFLGFRKKAQSSSEALQEKVFQTKERPVWRYHKLHGCGSRRWLILLGKAPEFRLKEILTRLLASDFRPFGRVVPEKSSFRLQRTSQILEMQLKRYYSVFLFLTFLFSLLFQL